jgi:hypothetical protein
MRNIKTLIFALILGLAGMVYAGGAIPFPARAEGQEKAASCCTKCSDSCCMKAQKAGDAKAAHKSCDMSKAGEGCCSVKADCCKPGAECCKANESCCKHNHASADKQSKTQACDMQKDGKGCCGTACDCCKEKMTM